MDISNHTNLVELFRTRTDAITIDEIVAAANDGTSLGQIIGGVNHAVDNNQLRAITVDGVTTYTVTDTLRVIIGGAQAPAQDTPAQQSYTLVLTISGTTPGDSESLEDLEDQAKDYAIEAQDRLPGAISVNGDVLVAGRKLENGVLQGASLNS